MKAIHGLIVFALATGYLFATDDGTPAAATCLELVALDGMSKNVCDKADKNFLILEFFNAKCPHCQRNVPWFKRLEAATHNNAYSRLISLSSDVDSRTFANDFIVTTEIVLDSAREALRAFGVTHVPTIFVLDRENKIVLTNVGVLGEADLARIATLINGETSQLPVEP